MQHNNSNPFPPPQIHGREYHRPPKLPSLSRLPPKNVNFQTSSQYWDIHPPTAKQVLDIPHPAYPHLTTRVTLKTPDQFGPSRRGSPIKVNSTLSTIERYQALEPKVVEYYPHTNPYPRAKTVERHEDRWKKESIKAKKRMEYAKTCAPSGRNVPFVEFKRVYQLPKIK